MSITHTKARVQSILILERSDAAPAVPRNAWDAENILTSIVVRSDIPGDFSNKRSSRRIGSPEIFLRTRL